MDKFLDSRILPIALVYFGLVGAFFVTGALLIAKVRRDRGVWGDTLWPADTPTVPEETYGFQGSDTGISPRPNPALLKVEGQSAGLYGNADTA
jgi:hypothetical protein